MTRETFLEIFKGNEDINFELTIKTRRPSCGSSWAFWEGEYEHNGKLHIHHISKCCNGFVIIDYYCEGYINDDNKDLILIERFCIPYENIIMVKFKLDIFSINEFEKLKTKKTNLK